MQNAEVISPATVIFTPGAVRYHAGIAFVSDDGELQAVHLAGHLRVRRLRDLDGWIAVAASLDPIELELVAANCQVLIDARPEVPYGLSGTKSRFLDGGLYQPGDDDTGLTCSTFVQKVFEWSLCPLVDESTWVTRVEDLPAQDALVRYLKDEAASAAHIAAVEADVSGLRIRPEEIGAAVGAPTTPVAFSWAEPNGICLAVQLDSYLSP